MDKQILSEAGQAEEILKQINQALTVKMGHQMGDYKFERGFYRQQKTLLFEDKK